MGQIAALAIVLCVATPAFAESAVAAAPVSTRLTVAQAREAQALFGFDVAIPKIVEEALKEQPQYRTMTPKQRECVLGVASPVFRGLFDDAFIELFGDSEALARWKAFSASPGGRIFMGGMRKTLLSRIDAGPEPDMAEILGTMSDAEKADIVAFMASPASDVIKKGFPDVDFPPGMQKTLQALSEKECGVTLDNP